MATSDDNSATIKVKQEPGVLKIKTEPGLRAQMKTERLSSFKLPRDLTLGGPGPGRTSRGAAPKKVYTPNLNAVRQKNTDVKTSRDTQQKKNVRSERGRSDRGGRGGGSNYIQTMGVFSEGTAKTIKRNSESRYSSSTSESRPIRRAVASRRDNLDTATAIKEILDSDDDDQAMDEDGTMPVMLQAAQTDRNVFNIAKDVKVKVETVENPDEISSNAPSVSTTVPFSTKVKEDPDEAKVPQTLEEIFGEKTSQIFLLQLPDALPGRTEEPDLSAEDQDTQMNEKERPIETTNNTLRHQDEGLVGKIVRYKSGKTKLILGSSQFDLDVGIDTDFLQQLVSIDTNTERRSGNMYNLGRVHTKLTATPDWEYMFRNMI